MTPATAVHGQQWHADAGFLVFDGATACLYQDAALRCVRERALHVVVKPRVDEQRCTQCDCSDQRKSGKENPATLEAHGAAVG